MVFQSTLPIQGETKSQLAEKMEEYISIHSPYTGRDQSDDSINPITQLFQSTLPIQGETFGKCFTK